VAPDKLEAIVIGASAGAVEALSILLPALPENYPLPILIVVHLPPDKNSILHELFRSKCRIAIREAEDKEPILPATVYFAPPDYHLLVEPDKTVALSSDEPVLYSRPSIDVLFESAADVYGPHLLGVVLTGANSDGARGLRAIVDAGGRAAVQSPQSASAAAMPQAALARCPDALCLNMQELVVYLSGIK
jgi:two-component system chemotaxis response regulator CheB